MLLLHVPGFSMQLFSMHSAFGTQTDNHRRRTRTLEYSAARECDVILTCIDLGTCCFYLLYFMICGMKFDRFLTNPRCCEPICLEKSVNKFSEVHEHAELTRRHPTAYKTNDVFVPYGFTQISRLIWRGQRDAFSLNRSPCAWTWYTSFEGYHVHW